MVGLQDLLVHKLSPSSRIQLIVEVEFVSVSLLVPQIKAGHFAIGLGICRSCLKIMLQFFDCLVNLRLKFAASFTVVNYFQVVIKTCLHNLVFEPNGLLTSLS